MKNANYGLALIFGILSAAGGGQIAASAKESIKTPIEISDPFLESPVRFYIPGIMLDQTTFKVQNGTTLGEVCVFLYGSQKNFQELAKMNSISGPDYFLKANSLLKLPQPPSLNYTDGVDFLSRMWIKIHLAKLKKTWEGYQESLKNERKMTVQQPKLDPIAKPSDLTGERARAYERLVEYLMHKKRNQSEKETTLEKLLEDAQANYKQGNDIKTLELYENASKLEPNSIPARFGELRLLVKLRKESEARSAADRFAQDFPELQMHPFVRRLTGSNPHPK